MPAGPHGCPRCPAGRLRGGGRCRRAGLHPPEKLDITGMFYWVIAVAALFEWEASAWKDNSLPWHPSLTDLINPLLGPHLVKSTAILLWILVGWALVRR